SGPIVSERKLPVVIFVHGESYEWGTGNAYDLSVFASYNQLVAISLNYRIGTLGFFATEDGSAKGNYALMDLRDAVQWVHANAAQFGGDPASITLMGHGYGAALVSLLMASKFAQGEPIFVLKIPYQSACTPKFDSSLGVQPCVTQPARGIAAHSADSPEQAHKRADTYAVIRTGTHSHRSVHFTVQVLALTAVNFTSRAKPRFQFSPKLMRLHLESSLGYGPLQSYLRRYEKSWLRPR
uniref:COesterase domain-containing protein n=1 Tax=Macrostomum lignano TaxID=282301 RepID=A0A1I8HYD0_9PLAT